MYNIYKSMQLHPYISQLFVGYRSLTSSLHMYTLQCGLYTDIGASERELLYNKAA